MSGIIMIFIGALPLIIYLLILIILKPITLNGALIESTKAPEAALKAMVAQAELELEQENDRPR